MSDPKGWLDSTIAVLERVFGALPGWVGHMIAIAVAIAIGIGAIAGLLRLVAEIRKSVRELLPPMLSDVERRRARKRRLFAEYLESEMRRLNSLESWQDYRFAELEAEVEAEGRRRIGSLLGLIPRSSAGLRREPSLSDALRRSEERLVLLEGEPGAGKSVALRHLALVLTTQARRSRSTRSPVPLYINLKEFQPGDVVVARDDLRAFVIRYLNRINDRDVEEFLEEEFDRGLREGTWLFLFDSFDEIPAVLSATESDTTVRRHADAISDFLHGMNRCRAIVASRVFRGPTHTPWPRFRILPLDDHRRRDLVRRAGLSGEGERKVIEGVAAGGSDIRLMASNPMFLGLLCDHARGEQAFPTNAHVAFEAYIDRRLNRDRERLQRRYKLAPAELKATAEAVAFVMTAERELGLSPSRVAIKSALVTLGRTEVQDADAKIDALEYLKLGRSEGLGAATEERTFTFAHRRFQEYFATCLVLRNPGLLAPRDFLLDARWRETAVVLCQTRSTRELQPLLVDAGALLNAAAADLANVHTPSDSSSPFHWPPHVAHVLGLIQDGFAGRMSDLPAELRQAAAQIVQEAMSKGSLVDRKWAIEIAGPMPEAQFIESLRNALSEGSRWLKEVAFRQAGRLGSLPVDLRAEIRSILVEMGLSGRLTRDWYATQAYLRRLENHEGLLRAARLLVSVRPIDLVLHCLVFLVLATIVSRHSGTVLVPEPVILSVFLVATVISHLLLVWGFHPSNLVYGRLSLALVTAMTLLISMIPANEGLSEFNWIAFWSGIAMLLCLFSWAPTAIVAARTERFVHPVQWPATPLVIVIEAIRLGREHPRALAFVIGGVLVWALAAVGLPLALDAAAEALPPDTKSVVSAVFGWLVALAALFSFGPLMFMWLREKFADAYDWVRWRRWAAAPGELTVQAMLELLGHFRTPRGKVRLLRIIRGKGMLKSGVDSHVALAGASRQQEGIVRAVNEAYARFEREIQAKKNVFKISRTQVLDGAKYAGVVPRRLRRAPGAYWELADLVLVHGDFEANLDLRDELSMLLEQATRSNQAGIYAELQKA